MLNEETAAAYLHSLHERLIQARKTVEIATTLIAASGDPSELLMLADQFAREAEADRAYAEARDALSRSIPQTAADLGCLIC